MDYKLEKELFVTGFNGTSMFELILVTGISGVAYFIHKMSLNFFQLAESPIFNFILSIPLLFIVILSQTYVEYLNYYFIFLLFTLLFMIYFKKKHLFEFTSREKIKSLNSKNSPFITGFRSLLMLSTSIAILAVDFTIFPRRFVKTEQYGTSLMDMGVGLFIISNSITSKQISWELSHTKTTYLYRLKYSITSVLPLLILGFVRYITNRAVNYQEHVSEYGLHWNFFFTLATVAILSSILNFKPRKSFLIGLITIILYQILLSFFSLEDYILHAPRVSLISANKEGIFSSIGYFSLYCLGLPLGQFLRSNTDNIKRWYNKCLSLLYIDIFLWIFLYFFNDYCIPSRRLVNISYVVWIIAMSIFYFLLTLGSELILKNRFSSLFESINNNMLFFFLISNISTGIVNLSIKTLYSSPLIALFILFTYSFFTTSISFFLHYFNIKLKIW